jgi:hypothetical protein
MSGCSTYEKIATYRGVVPISALTRELSLQTEDDKIVLHPNIGELYARKIGDLKSLIQNDTTKHQATEIIQSLIEKIVVSPKSPAWQKRCGFTRRFGVHTRIRKRHRSKRCGVFRRW